MPSANPVVLDTHTWIWLMLGAPPLTPGARIAIADAARVGAVRIASISTWEIAMLERRRRITLSTPVLDWIQSALNAPGISLAPLTPEIAVDSYRLPGNPPQDLADRLIIATARANSAHLVTRDLDILSYATREKATSASSRHRTRP